jgi:hypothetical protein
MMMLEDPIGPGSFDEAYNHSDLDPRIKWRSAIDEEFKLKNFADLGRKSTNLICVMVIDVSKAMGV